MRKKIFIIIGLIFSITFIAQQNSSIGYSFIKLAATEQTITSSANTNQYISKTFEEESIYGSKMVQLEKKYQLYKELINIYFDNNGKIINFTVRFIITTKKSRTSLETLFISIQDKLTEKYGDSEREGVPYYKFVSNKFIVYLKPIFPASEGFDLYFEDYENYNLYKQYYEEKMKSQETEEVQSIVDSL